MSGGPSSVAAFFELLLQNMYSFLMFSNNFYCDMSFIMYYAVHHVHKSNTEECVFSLFGLSFSLFEFLSNKFNNNISKYYILQFRFWPECELTGIGWRTSAGDFPIKFCLNPELDAANFNINCSIFEFLNGINFG